MSLNIKALDQTQILDISCCNNSAVSSYGATSTCIIMAIELCIDGLFIFHPRFLFLQMNLWIYLKYLRFPCNFNPSYDVVKIFPPWTKHSVCLVKLVIIRNLIVMRILKWSIRIIVMITTNTLIINSWVVMRILRNEWYVWSKLLWIVNV